jgi:serine/threonine protein kinase
MIDDAVGPLPVEDSVRRRAIKARLFGVDDPPVRIGKYVLEAALGAGAMGVVLSAHDETLDRRVAIKLLRPEIAAAARLEREARALARLAHPNVVTIHEVGEHDGRTFLVMEHVPGVSLRAWAAQPRALAAKLEILCQAAAGLHAAHRLGLVHRDFKPENAIVGADGRLRVVDFGLAAEPGELPTQEGSPSVASPLHPHARLTQTGQLLGTPAYMAPEVLAGEPATPRSDQFALACVAWEVLFGRHPFEGGTSARDRPEPPVGSRVPGRVRRAVVRGLHPDPHARHDDLAALARALEPSRGRGGAIAVGVAALVLGASVATLASMSSRDPVAALEPAATPPSTEHGAAEGIRPVPPAREIARGLVGPDGCPLVRFDRPRATLARQHPMLLELLRATDEGTPPPSEHAAVLASVAEVELALGLRDDACAKLERARGLDPDEERAACWIPRHCATGEPLPERARCFGGDARACTRVAIRHEYELLEARATVGAGRGGTEALRRAQSELDALLEMLDRACELQDGDACAQAKTYRGSELASE